MLHPGPQPQTHADRLTVAWQLCERLQSRYGDQILAIALYGSMARQQDGPYSDIEMFCVMDTPDMDHAFEWVYGAGKAEINVLGSNDARWEAREVENDWALTKGQFLHARLLFGDEAVLAELRKLALAVSDAEINEMIGGTVVGELYEWIGKIRNARHRAQFAGVPGIACQFAEMVALLLGLAHRTCYTTGMTLLDESLQFPDLPTGYGELCDLVQRGQLGEPVEIIGAMEAAWSGVVDWAAARGVQVPVGAWPF